MSISQKLSLTFIILFLLLSVYIVVNTICFFDGTASIVKLILWLIILSVNIINSLFIFKNNKKYGYKMIFWLSLTTTLFFWISIILSLIQIKSFMDNSKTLGIVSIVAISFLFITTTLYDVFLINIIKKKDYLTLPVHME